MPSMRVPTTVVLSPLRAVGGIARPIARVDQAFRRLEELVAGLTTIHEEMVGMRTDVRDLGRRVDALRGDVQHLFDGVGGIRSATESLDGRVADVTRSISSVDEHLGGLSASMQSVDALAARLGRFTGRRARRGADPAPADAAKR